ncbi:MAG: 1,2-phenylacetyl-CoA epoxidase subunit PaaC [Aeromicrobium sp.]
MTSRDQILQLADDALILSHRCAEWLTRAPEIEEDVALANIGLDLLGQARSLYALVGDEDRLAYFRDAPEWRNCRLVELPNGDFAFSMARLLVFSSFQLTLAESAIVASDPGLSAVFAKSVKESRYHFDHATQWVLRLGDGTAFSRQRMQVALESIWPHVEDVFAIAPDSRSPAMAKVEGVIRRATLTVPDTAKPEWGGRQGIHTDHLVDLLDEMQSVARQHEGATW